MRAADAKRLWKRLKKDPSADADAVAEAKKRYKGLKRQLEAEVGAKRARAAPQAAGSRPPTEEAASEDVRAAKAAWKALKAQGADKAVVKSAKAKYKAAKEREMNARAGATSAAKRQKTGQSDGADQPMFNSFADSPFSKTILSSLSAAGFASPTAIQARAWPIILTGADLIAIAKTGSGKTLAFLLPAFHRLSAQPSPTVSQSALPSPEILVVAPTRELCIQIAAAAKQFGGKSETTTHAIYGGVPTR